MEKEQIKAEPEKDEGKVAPAEAEETGREPEQEKAAPAEERDFIAEVAELAREFPEAGRDGRLPDEVVLAAVRDGKPVLVAYREYALAHAGGDEPAETVKKAARSAPVRGVSGGWPVEGQASDPFMEGFTKD